MAHLKSTEEINMRRSFSWNRDFFTSDGFLDAEELSNMIEGGVDDDVDHELQKFEEIENLEAKLFQEIEASTQKSTQTSVKKNSQAKSAKTKSIEPPAKSPPSHGGSGGKKVKSPARKSMSSKTSTGITTKNKVGPVNTRVSRTPPASPGSSGSSTSSMFPVKQRPKRSSSAPRRSSISNEKPSPTNARLNNEKTTINKASPINTRMSRTPPASPGSSSTKRSSSAPRRSSINNEKPSSINTRRNNEKPLTMNKASPVNTRLSRTPPSQGSKRSSSAPRRSSLNNEKPLTKNDEYKTKNKVTPAKSNISVSKTLPSSPVSYSPTFCNNQRSRRSNSVPRRSSMNQKPIETNESGSDEWKFSKPAVVLIPKTQSSISLKTKPPPVLSHPSMLSESSSSSSSSSTSKVNQKSKTSVRNEKSAASRSETRSPNGSKMGRNLSPKTVSQKNTTTTATTTSKPTRKQSSAKVKAKAKSASGVSRGAEDIILVSPEVMDIKGKLNALKMEISMQKKLGHDEKGVSSSIIQINNQTKSKHRI